MRINILIIMMFLMLQTPVFAANKITDDKAIKAIIGEAEGEPQRGRLAVACAIRNRGHLSGVYGINAPRVKNKKYNASTYKAASAAWSQSASAAACAFVRGADGWENVNAFGVPYWAASSTHTVTIGNHKFYIQNTKPQTKG